MIKSISHCAARAVTVALSVSLLTIGLSLPNWVSAQVPAPEAAMCALPGKDGGGNASSVVNDYFGGSAGTLNAGASSVTLGTKDGRGANKQVQIGDLLMFIQMQDAAISTSNNATMAAAAMARDQPASIMPVAMNS